MGRLNFNLCNKEFWNDFFSPRNPGLFIILILVILDAIYTCAFVLMSTYYDNYSDSQHAGYFGGLCANIIVIISGFLSIHFLTLKPKHMTLTYCAFLHVGLLAALLLGSISIILMAVPPPIEEIQRYTKRYIQIYLRANYLMRNIFQEKKCCGILSFGDVFPDTTRKINNVTVHFHRIPPSCCNQDPAILNRCELWVKNIVNVIDFQTNNRLYLNQNHCLQSGQGYEFFAQTKTHETYVKTIYASLVVFVFIFGILAVLTYYIWLKFPKVPRNQRPMNLIEDLRDLMTFRWCKLKRKSKARAKRALQNKIDPSHHKSRDFVMRHELMKQSLANMRTLHKDIKAKEQLERQLDAARSASQAIPTTISTRSFKATTP